VRGGHAIESGELILGVSGVRLQEGNEVGVYRTHKAWATVLTTEVRHSALTLVATEVRHSALTLVSAKASAAL
jgi:hypothetical protein